MTLGCSFHQAGGDKCCKWVQGNFLLCLHFFSSFMAKGVFTLQQKNKGEFCAHSICCCEYSVCHSRWSSTYSADVVNSGLLHFRDSNCVFVANLVDASASWYFISQISCYEASLLSYSSGASERQVVCFFSIFQFKKLQPQRSAQFRPEFSKFWT